MATTDVLERMGWAPRDLVGPDSVPKLTTFEDLIEQAITSHRHGQLLKTEGNVPIYEAEPIQSELIPITDVNNAENLTLAQHMKDESIHITSSEIPPSLKAMQCSINLLEETEAAPDYEEGNITESWVNSAVPVSHTQPEQNRGNIYYWASGVPVNDLWTPWFHGCQQRFLTPDSFSIAKPKFGRVFQNGYYTLYESSMTLDSPMPTRIAFDYIWFPYRTWYMLFQASSRYRNYSFDRVVLKRYRTQAFPDGYRVTPGQMQVFNQFRQRAGHSLSSANLDKIYWPQRAYDSTGTPSHVVQGDEYPVPRVGEYSDDPGNMIRSYVGNSSYERSVIVSPDFSTFEAAQNAWVGGFDKQANVWKELRSKYYPPNPGNPDIYNHQFYDWFLPINSQDNFSFRLLHNQPIDNQIDLFPLSMCGFIIILPYGYLPLYHKTLGGTPDYVGNDIGTFWARAALHMAKSGQSITWVPGSGSVDYLVPMLVDSGVGDNTWGYPYPKELALDVMLIGPDS